MQRSFIFAGVFLVFVGLFWKQLAKLPFGRLPGDLMLDRPGLKVWIPLTSMLIVSAVVSLAMWLMRRP